MRGGSRLQRLIIPCVRGMSMNAKANGQHGPVSRISQNGCGIDLAAQRGGAARSAMPRHKVCRGAMGMAGAALGKVRRELYIPRML